MQIQHCRYNRLLPLAQPLQLTVMTAYVFAADKGLLWNARCLLALLE